MIRKIKHLPITLLLLLCAGLIRANGIAGPNLTICFGTNTIMNATGTTGTWSNSVANPTPIIFGNIHSRTSNVSGMSIAGNYVAIWNNGSATDSVTITVETPVVANAGLDTAFCNGDGYLGGGRSSGSPPTGLGGRGTYTYHWAPSTAMNSTTLANPFLSGASPNTYHVTVTDSYGCTATDSIVITLPYVIGNAGNDTTICLGASVMLGGSPTGQGNPASGIEYAWYDAAGSGFSSAANPTVMPTVTATYHVYVSTSSCVGAYHYITVTVDTCFGPAGPDRNVCYNMGLTSMSALGMGGTWSAMAGNPAAITFFTPSSPTSVVLGLTVSGTYGAIWTTGSGADTAYIIVGPSISAAAATDTTICAGSCVDIGGSPTGSGGTGALTYHWFHYLSGSISLVSNPVVCPPSSDYFTLAVRDSLGCQDTASVYVTVVNCHPDAGPDQSMCFNAGPPSMSATGTGIWSALASNPAAISFFTPASPTSVVLGLTVPGVYGAIWTDGAYSDTAFITVWPQVVSDAGPDTTICSGICTLLGGSPTATGGAFPYTYTWFTGSAVMSTVPNATVCPTVSTYYTVLVADVHGCMDTAGVYVTVNSCTSGNAGPDQSICQNNSFGYATAFMAATGSGSWSALATNPSSTTINAPSSPTTYIQGFTVPGIYGFVWSSDTVFVTVLPSPARPVLTLVGPCLGYDSLILTGGHGDSILWVIGTTTLYGVNGADSILIPTSATSYLAFIFGANGCHSDMSDTVWVVPCTPDSVWPGRC